MTDLLGSVLEAHGGLAAWRDVRSIDVTWNFSGQMLDLKGFPGHRQPVATIDVHRPRVVLQRLGGDPDDRWVFTPERVWIEKRDGRVVAERADPRGAFADHELTTPWDDLHLTYFIGYAMWNYLCTPFLFTEPGFTTEDTGTHDELGETWRVLRVTYPSDVATHTQVQNFYFDQEFMLRRLDYAVDVIPGGVTAHYCYDPRRVGGIVVPTTRRVVVRTPEDAVLSSRSIFLLDYVDVAVQGRSGPGD